jgi:protein TonB
MVKPTDLQMRKANPSRARLALVSGGAVISCLVTPRNRARDCHILTESPRDYGFGDAAIQLSIHFRIKPPERDGRPRHDVRVRIPVYFDNLK